MPSCPTADGELDGTDKHPLEVRIVVSYASGTLRSQTVKSNSSESLHGTVADDAELDELVINDHSSFGFITAGSEVGHVISEHVSISRRALVNMRVGYPLAFSGAVSITGRVDGISLSCRGRPFVAVTRGALVLPYGAIPNGPTQNVSWLIGAFGLGIEGIVPVSSFAADQELARDEPQEPSSPMHR